MIDRQKIRGDLPRVNMKHEHSVNL